MSLSDSEIRKLLEKAASLKKLDDEAGFGGDTGILKEALNCYNRIIENTPPNSHYFMERSMMKYTLSSRTGSGVDLNDAIADINQAIALDQQQPVFYWLRGIYLLQKLEAVISSGNNEQLLKEIASDFKASLEKDPSSSRVWLDLMVVNIIRRDWDDVISLYGSCNPYITHLEERLYRSWLGCLALALSGDPIEEEDSSLLYDSTIHTKSNIRVSLISAFLNQIRNDEGLKGKWEKVIFIQELFLKHLSPLDRAGAFWKLGDYDRAISECKSGLDVNPRNSYGWLYLAGCLMTIGRYEEELEALNKALELEPNNIDSWNNKAWALSKLERHEEALKALERPIKLNPGNSYSWFIKGYCLAQIKRHSEAITAYKKVLELGHSEMGMAWFNLGWSLEKLGRYEEALQAFDRAIELNSNYSDAWFNKGYCFQELNRYNEAIAAYRRLIGLGHSEMDIAWNNMGLSFEKLGRYEEAIIAYENALELNPHNDRAKSNKLNLIARIKK